MGNRIKSFTLAGILASSIFLLLVIPLEDFTADATRDDKPPGISMFFCGHNKIKKQLKNVMILLLDTLGGQRSIF